jgi:hypothetical protein
MNRQQTLVALFLSFAVSGALRAQIFTTLQKFDGTTAQAPTQGWCKPSTGISKG